MEKHEVNSISLKGGITISFGVRVETEEGEYKSEHLTVTKFRTPHQDFKAAFEAIKPLAERMIELPLQNGLGERIQLVVSKIKFVEHKDYGAGVRIAANLYNLAFAEKNILINTPVYYQKEVGSYTHNGREIFNNKLTEEEYKALELLKEEAFKYAYYDKCEQPTVMEAQEAYEAGGYADET